MSNLSISVHDGGRMLMDITPWLHPERGGSLSLDRNEHGDGSLTATLATTRQVAARMRGWPDTARLFVHFGLQRVWAGRLEDVSGGGVMHLRAFGPWQTLKDVDFTALWSVSGSSGWREVNPDELSFAAPGRYAMDARNRVKIAVQKGSESSSDYRGVMVYELPDKAEQVSSTIRISLHYDMTAFNGLSFEAVIRGYDDSWNQINSATITSGSTPDSGTFLTSFSGSVTKVAILFGRSSTTAVEYTGETDDEAILIITDLVIRSATSGTVLASDIAAGLASHINSINPDELSDSAGLIETTTQNLLDAIYIDQYAANILTDLIVAEQLEVGVTERVGPALVYLRERYKYARAVYTVGATMDHGRSLDPVRNRMAGIYREPGGRRLRTDAADDPASQLQRGLVRSGSIKSQTTAVSEAEALRDAALADAVDAERQSLVVVNELFNKSGGRIWLHDMDAGDELVLRDLPLETVAAISIRAARTKVEIRDNQMLLHVEPADPVPTVETLLANL